MKAMFFDGEPTGETISHNPALAGISLALIVPVLLFGVYGSPLMNLVRPSLEFFSQGM